MKFYIRVNGFRLFIGKTGYVTLIKDAKNFECADAAEYYVTHSKSWNDERKDTFAFPIYSL